MNSGENVITPERAKLFWMVIGGVVAAFTLASLLLQGTAFATTGEGELAAEAFEMSSGVSSPIQQCAAAGQVADAYLRDQNRSEYLSWKEQERLICLGASFCSQTVGGCAPANAI